MEIWQSSEDLAEFRRYCEQNKRNDAGRKAWQIFEIFKGNFEDEKLKNEEDEDEEDE